MSIERWSPYTKAISVRTGPDGRIVVRPRRLPASSAVVIGTSLAAALSLSGAVGAFQVMGPPSWMNLLGVLASSTFLVVMFGKYVKHHPERWRFLAWWLAFAIAKMVFASSAPFLMIPLELMLLLPAYLAAHRSATLRGISLREMDLSGTDLGFVHFVEADLSECEFNDCVFTGVHFERCRLVGIRANRSEINACVFAGCDLTDAKLNETRWSHGSAYACTFAHASLIDASFRNVNLQAANFTGADLRGTVFWSPPATAMTPCLDGAQVVGAKYDAQTVWPADAMPIRWGAIKVD